jgi:hypothetical protein
MANEELLKTVIFGDKTFEGLLEDIYKSVQTEDETIKATIDSMLKMLTGSDPDDPDVDISSLLGFVAPTIKDFLDVSIKNKKHWLDLANVVQKLLQASKLQTEMGEGMPWETKRDQIIEQSKNEGKKIQKSVDESMEFLKKRVVENDPSNDSGSDIAEA